jgi:hypothetical protein
MSKPVGVARTLFPGAGGEALVFALPPNFSIAEEVERSSSVRLATAYGKIRGWERIEEAVLKSNSKVYLLAGLDFGLTEPALLRRWLRLRNDGRIHAKVFNRGANFHPKVLIVERQRGRDFAIVGSGNLSGGGLLTNIECSVYTVNNGILLRLRRWFDGLFCDERTRWITRSLIKGYEPFHQLVKRHRREADKAGRRFSDRAEQLRRPRLNETLRGPGKRRSPFFYVNTNVRYSDKAHQEMLSGGEACAFYDAKELIDKIPAGAVVFLYRSSKWGRDIPGESGIVAFGEATGKLVERSSYRGDPREAHCRKLGGFRQLDHSISAPEIRKLSRRVLGYDIAFNGTSREVDTRLGTELYEIALRRSTP